MKKVLSFLAVLATMCCFSTELMARATAVQEYDFKDLGGMGSRTDEKCTAKFPLTARIEGYRCEKHSSKNCWACYCPDSFLYTETDCGELIPSGKSCKNPDGTVKYENCKCPTDYYTKDELNDITVASSFIYTKKTNKNGKQITCYKLEGCKNGKTPITKADGFSISEERASKEINTCTELKVASALKDEDDANNIWCATGYECKESCSKDKGTLTCVDTGQDKMYSAYYDGGYCEYFSNCAAGGSCISNYLAISSTINPSINVADLSIKFYKPNEHKHETDKCYYASGCKLDASKSEGYLYGEQNLTGGTIEGIKADNYEYAGAKCSVYTCDTGDGWRNVAAISNQSVNIPEEVAKWEEAGAYDVAYVRNSAGAFFACRKENISECHQGCATGRYYARTTNSCYTDDSTSEFVYVRRNDDEAVLLDLEESKEHSVTNIASNDAVDPDNLTKEEVRVIANYLKEKFGAGKCFATNTGIVLLKEDGSLTDIIDDNLNLCPKRNNPANLQSSILTSSQGSMLAYSVSIHSSETIANAAGASFGPNQSTAGCNTTNRNECINAGCTWYNGRCYMSTMDPLADSQMQVEVGGYLDVEDVVQADGCPIIQHCKEMNENCRCTKCEDGYEPRVTGLSCETKKPAIVISLKGIKEDCTGGCYQNCVAGSYYDDKTETCYTGNETSDRVYISNKRDKARFLYLRLAKEKILYNMDSNTLVTENNITKDEVSKIADYLLQKFGAGKCFATSEGIIKLNGDKTLTDIVTSEDLVLCKSGQQASNMITPLNSSLLAYSATISTTETLAYADTTGGDSCSAVNALQGADDWKAVECRMAYGCSWSRFEAKCVKNINYSAPAQSDKCEAISQAEFENSRPYDISIPEEKEKLKMWCESDRDCEFREGQGCFMKEIPAEIEFVEIPHCIEYGDNSGSGSGSGGGMDLEEAIENGGMLECFACEKGYKVENYGNETKCVPEWRECLRRWGEDDYNCDYPNATQCYEHPRNCVWNEALGKRSYKLEGGSSVETYCHEAHARDCNFSEEGYCRQFRRDCVWVVDGPSRSYTLNNGTTVNTKCYSYHDVDSTYTNNRVSRVIYDADKGKGYIAGIVGGNYEVAGLETMVRYEGNFLGCKTDDPLFSGASYDYFSSGMIVDQDACHFLAPASAAAKVLYVPYDDDEDVKKTFSESWPNDEYFGRGKWYLPTLGEWMEAYGFDWSKQLNENYTGELVNEATNEKYPLGAYGATGENKKYIDKTLALVGDELHPGEPYLAAGGGYFYWDNGKNYPYGGSNTWGYVRPFLLLENVYCGAERTPEIGDIVASDLSITPEKDYGFNKLPIGVVVAVSDDGGSVKIMALEDAIKEKTREPRGDERFNSSTYPINSNAPREKQWYLQHRFEAVGEGTLKTFCGKCEAVNPPKVIPLKPVSHKCGDNDCDIPWEDFKTIRDLTDYNALGNPEVKECCNHFWDNQTPIDGQGWRETCCKVEPYKTQEDKVGGSCYICDLKSPDNIYTANSNDDLEKREECCLYNHNKYGSFSGPFTDNGGWTGRNCCNRLKGKYTLEDYPECEAKKYEYDFYEVASCNRTDHYAAEKDTCMHREKMFVTGDELSGHMKTLPDYAADGYIELDGTTITFPKGKYTPTNDGWANQEAIDQIDESVRINMTLDCPYAKSSVYGHPLVHRKSIRFELLPLGRKIDLSSLENYYETSYGYVYSSAGDDYDKYCDGYNATQWGGLSLSPAYVVQWYGNNVSTDPYSGNKEGLNDFIADVLPYCALTDIELVKVGNGASYLTSAYSGPDSTPAKDLLENTIWLNYHPRVVDACLRNE